MRWISDGKCQCAIEFCFVLPAIYEFIPCENEHRYNTL